MNPSDFDKKIATMASFGTPGEGPTVYVRHRDPNGTGERHGSHARGALYPLLRMALHFGWHILWDAPLPAFGVANHRTEYADELQH